MKTTFLFTLALVLCAGGAQALEIHTFNLQPVPCRLADTRGVGVTPAGSTVNLVARGGNAWVGQGGQVGCGAAVQATAVVVTISALGPDRAGQVLAWAYGTPANQVPNGTATMILNPGISASSQVTIPLCTAASCPYDFSLFAVPALNYTVDLIGYFD